jgi:hypothetical protein
VSERIVNVEGGRDLPGSGEIVEDGGERTVERSGGHG